MLCATVITTCYKIITVVPDFWTLCNSTAYYRNGASIPQLHHTVHLNVPIHNTVAATIHYIVVYYSFHQVTLESVVLSN